MFVNMDVSRLNSDSTPEIKVLENLKILQVILAHIHDGKVLSSGVMHFSAH